jgi:hypothetical protein
MLFTYVDIFERKNPEYCTLPGVFAPSVQFPRFTKYINRTEISWVQGWCKHPRESAIFRIFSLKDIHICKQHEDILKGYNIM